MSRQYQYIKINNYCFCLQQNLATLAWILFFKRDDLISVFTPWTKQSLPGNFLGYYRFYYRLFKDNFKMLFLFMGYRFNLRDIDPVVELPVYGHICLHVHKGNKIFNLRTRTVIKLFDSDVNRNSIADEIGRLQTVSSMDFAPSLGKWNIDERWYEEEYILEYPPSSYKSRDAVTLLKSFNHEIVPCLSRLMLFKQPKSIHSFDYVSKMISILESHNSSRQGLDMNGARKTSNFVNTISQLILNKDNADIYLVYSHGDFCPANIMETKYGIKILDWESSEYRSALFDYYSYFFYLAVCINHPLDNLVPKLHETFLDFISKLSFNDSNIQNNLSTKGNIYRWIFYIEYICKLVEREVTDKNLDIMDFIIRYIDAFNNYEDILLSSSNRKKPTYQFLNYNL